MAVNVEVATAKRAAKGVTVLKWSTNSHTKRDHLAVMLLWAPRNFVASVRCAIPLGGRTENHRGYVRRKDSAMR